MNYTDNIKQYLSNVKQCMDILDIDDISNCIKVIKKYGDNGRRIFIFGNGGSASTASHFTNDFNKGVNLLANKNYKMECLNDNVSTIMAIANDNSYDDIFELQLHNKLSEGDLVIGISGSGNSKNIVKALEYAKSFGAITIGVTGFSGGEVKKITDYSLHVPVDNMQITEDIHMIFNHMMMSILSNKVN